MDMSHRFGRVRFSTLRGRMPRWTLAAGAAAGLLLAVPAQALATADAVDQAFPTNVLPSTVNSTKLMAQTFTASTTGQIDKVSLSLESHSNLVTGWVQIRTVAADGSPTGGTLQPSATPIQFTYPFGNAYHDYTISPAFPITAGTQYAIVWTAKVADRFLVGQQLRRLHRRPAVALLHRLRMDSKRDQGPRLQDMGCHHPPEPTPRGRR